MTVTREEKEEVEKLQSTALGNLHFLAGALLGQKMPNADLKTVIAVVAEITASEIKEVQTQIIEDIKRF